MSTKANKIIQNFHLTIELFFGCENKAKAWIAKARKAGAQLDEPKKKEKNP